MENIKLPEKIINLTINKTDKIIFYNKKIEPKKNILLHLYFLIASFALLVLMSLIIFPKFFIEISDLYFNGINLNINFELIFMGIIILISFIILILGIYRTFDYIFGEGYLAILLDIGLGVYRGNKLIFYKWDNFTGNIYKIDNYIILKLKKSKIGINKKGKEKLINIKPPYLLNSIYFDLKGNDDINKIEEFCKEKIRINKNNFKNQLKNIRYNIEIDNFIKNTYGKKKLKII